MGKEVQSGRGMLFAPITAPTIKSISRKSVLEFLAAREAYEDAVSSQPGMKAVSYRSCFNRVFLKSLVRARAFGAEVSSVNELSDEVIKSKLQEISGYVSSISVESALNEVKANVRLDTNEPDARLRILMLSTSYLELCEKRGWKFVENSPKAAIKHIISVLQPPGLKARMNDALALERTDLKSDYFGFMEFLADKAEIFEEVIPLKKTFKNRPPAPPSFGKGRPTTKLSAPTNPKDKGSNSVADDFSKGSGNSSKLPVCLNPKCSERHYVKNCPRTSAEYGKKLLDEWRNNKEARKARNASSNVVTSSPSPTSNKTASAKSNSSSSAVISAEVGGFKFACRIDSGADENGVSDTIVNFLGDKGIFLPTRLLSEPKKLTAVDGHVVLSRGKCQMSPSVDTMAGPCRLRNLHLSILENNESHIRPGHSCAGEIILGNPFLVASGLDVKDFLASNLEKLASIDYGTLETLSVPSRVGNLGMHLLKNEIDIDVVDLDPSRVGSMMSNGNFPLKDGDDVQYKDVEVGEQDESELQQAIEAMVDTSSMHCKNNLEDTLKDLAHEFKDIFRIKLGNDPPVNVEPMKIEFEGIPRPIKVRQRSYSPEQLEFLKRKVKELSDAGFITRNNASKWACAPLVVPKAGKEGFRFTVDLRPVNSQTKPAVWPMPHADQMLAKLNGSKYWFKLDFLHGYWQFPLDDSSAECQSFHTPFGVYTPKRVLHGSTNAVSYFQSSMESMFAHLDLLIYLDDLLGYAVDPTSLLEKLRLVFGVCRVRGLKLNPEKCQLITQEVQFCGRTINKNGIKFHPRQYDALTNMSTPRTIGALIELVHGSNWMRSAIPKFAELIAPLHELLEKNYSKEKTRKKTRIANRPISAWRDEHDTAFTNLISAIKEQTILATADPKKRLCLFTDASEKFWSGVLTQVEHSQFKSEKTPNEWEHNPLGFVSGAFRGSSVRWTMPEKECYAIVSSVIRLSHTLVSCAEFSLFTDHKNLLFMLNPSRFNSNVARHVVHKVQRWALRLAEFNFTIEHIPGEANLWADILTRWAAPNRDEAPARRSCAIRVPLLTEETPELPSLDILAASQLKFPPPENSEFILSSEDNLWRNLKGKLYVPNQDEELQLRMAVSAHSGFGGHRGYTTTLEILKEKLHWDNMEGDVKSFVNGCLVCLLSSSGNHVRRPLGTQIHAERVGELLHFDFLYVGESTNHMEYVLLLKDDFSGYCFLRACQKADAATTAEVLMEYFTTFVPVLQWFSDQGTHFKNEVMELLANSLGVKHHFSTPYVPWSNGTVESVCKQFLRVMRAFSAEFRIPESDWPTTVPAVQSIINNSPSRRLGNRAPITVHTGMEPGNPLNLALSAINYSDADSVQDAQVMQELKIVDLLDSLDRMHRNVNEVLSETRKSAVERHNARTGVHPCNLVVGDYVVVARVKGPRTKMSANWVGPRRIVECLSGFVYRVENLITGETEDIHISRIKHYADSMVGTSVQLKEIADFSDRVWYSVDKIKNLRENDGVFELLVSWKGLSDSGDSWEPLNVMQEDVPSKVRQYFKRKRNTGLVKRALETIKGSH